MSCKIDAIMKLYEAKGRVVISLDRRAGLDRLTLTKGKGGLNLACTHPGCRIISVTVQEIRSNLESMRMFITGWK